MKKHSIILLLLILLQGCAAKSHLITGKVAEDKTPIPNINVYAFKAQSMLDFTKPDFKAKTDDIGEYNISVKEDGDYYLTAKTLKGGTDEIDLYAYYGRNPVYVSKSGVSDINLKLKKITSSVKSEKSDFTGIKFMLTHNGKPLSGATMYLALDLNEGMQTKGFMQSDLSDDNGEVYIQIEKGTYYFTSRKRLKDAFGPMSAGDLIGFFHDNPLVVDDNLLYTVNIELLEIPENISTEVKNPSKAIITGKVTNEDGEPLQNIWVGAYIDPQMFGKPVYISKKSGADGTFTLHIEKPGKYFLSARDTLGGPPNPGEMFGTYSETDDHSITVEQKAKLKDVNLTLKEMW